MVFMFSCWPATSTSLKKVRLTGVIGLAGSGGEARALADLEGRQAERKKRTAA